MKVDLISRQGDWQKISEEEMEAVKNSEYIDQAWFSHRKPPKKNSLLYFFQYKLWHMLFNLKLKPVKGAIPNLVNLHLRTAFDTILKNNHYDYIIISYAYYADLIKDNPLVAKSFTIIDTHDLLTSQHKDHPKFDIGKSLGEELRRLELFDQVWAISPEEQYFFSQFLGEKIKYIPMMLPEPATVSGNKAPEYDLIYVASNNHHNQLSAKWFFDEVYPLLSKNIKMKVIGAITSHIPQDLSNVTLIPFADDLEVEYRNARVALCPILSGTGVKIKVVEALSLGLPVVCNTRGQDGLPDKSNNGCLVTDDAAEFAGYIKQLLEDPAFLEEQGALSKAAFRKNFVTDNIYKRLDSALNLDTRI
jgi:glycosyltransferase involved in cell wall biosynthesis